MRSTLAALAAATLLAAPPAGAAAPDPAAAPAARSATSAKPGKPVRPAKAGQASHPDVGAGPGDCASCHATATPEAFEAWRQSKHGLALVKCFVCHGPTGAGFTRRPPPSRCLGCHGEEVSDLGEGAKGKDCFACHASHALSPHAAKRGRTAADRLGADAALERERKAGPVNGPAAPPPAPPTSTSTPTPPSTPTAPKGTTP